MNLLFLHQSFPGQFVRLAPALARQGHRVVGLHLNDASPVPGVDVRRYAITINPIPDLPTVLSEFEAKHLRARGALAAARQLQDEGFTPDIIIAHPGWGETLLLELVWPDVPQIHLCEFFYAARGTDIGFDPELSVTSDEILSRALLKNAAPLLALHGMYRAVSPTHFQKQQFPAPYHDRIDVIHDGIDTDRVCPDPTARFELPGGRVLVPGDPVVTFVNRNLEPQRGFHIFMRSLPAVLRAHPTAQVCIVGADGRGYGGAAPGGETWRQIMLREVGNAIPADRVHFLGHLPYNRYVNLLQVSAAHVYLTYPFVLGWSCIEAMSAGCAIIGSRTAPVQEVIRDGENGHLVDFFDIEGLAARILSVLADPVAARKLGEQARQDAISRYDWSRVSWPAWQALIDRVRRERVPAPAALPEPATVTPAAKPAPVKTTRAMSVAEGLKQIQLLFQKNDSAGVVDLAASLYASAPKNGKLLHLWGAALLRLGRNAEGLEKLEQAAILSPKDAEIWDHLGVARHRLTKLPAADEAYQRSVALDPTRADAWGNAAKNALVWQRYDIGEHYARKALSLRKDSLWAMNHLISILLEAQKLPEAEAELKGALAQWPDNLELKQRLAQLYVSQNRTHEGLEVLESLAQAVDDAPVNWDCLGSAYVQAGQYEKAEAAFRRAISCSVPYAPAHNNLGVLLYRLGRWTEALQQYARAREVAPDDYRPILNSGVIHFRAGRYDEALAHYQVALKANPDSAALNNNIAQCMEGQGRMELAIQYRQRALDLDKSDPRLFSGLLMALSHADNVDPATLFQRHLEFARNYAAPLAGERLDHADHDRTPGRTLRVAFISGDLWDHAVSRFIKPLLPELQSPGFEWWAYHTSTMEDRTSDELRQHFKTWRNISAMKDADIVQMIAADKIDILIDLSGHTANNRLLALARKPAPIQASWIGYPATTGLDAVDYYFVDADWAPPGSVDDQFVEKLVRLPSVTAFQGPAESPDVTDPPCLSSGRFTFGSFNRTSKLSPRTLDLWCRVLRAVPQAGMVLGNVSDLPLRAKLEKEFADRGITSDRLTFHPNVKMQDYLALHGSVDLILDTFPYSGGTTTGLALWMGVPVVTYAYPTLPGRQGVALMSRVGLADQFVAETEDMFVALAARWAADPEGLRVLRHQLRGRMRDARNCRSEFVAEGVKRGLLMMWERYCAGLPPETITVPSP